MSLEQHRWNRLDAIARTTGMPVNATSASCTAGCPPAPSLAACREGQPDNRTPESGNGRSDRRGRRLRADRPPHS
ncbi:hypothetical protein HL658_18785 [Azospirillum sp. RWY-5-1]|uniref:Uncharacterized protein n=1 Tax=Azospirillum oleiclasticum TaxID=2735135 RepID=A0ABX2TM98_9PROT|nr:hypothetical protein [Azospirillum oleiclasticum]NYZ24378.1 hypothetical protein [Azospirillum oleiclasticum]